MFFTKFITSSPPPSEQIYPANEIRAANGERFETYIWCKSWSHASSLSTLTPSGLSGVTLWERTPTWHATLAWAEPPEPTPPPKPEPMPPLSPSGRTRAAPSDEPSAENRGWLCNAVVAAAEPLSTWAWTTHKVSCTGNLKYRISYLVCLTLIPELSECTAKCEAKGFTVS